jgi:uncharacterized protein (TIGR03118 family)
MFSWISLPNRRPAKQRIRSLPTLEVLENRAVPATVNLNIVQTNLVSDIAGVAAATDPQLINPWGISESAGSPFWVSDNNAGVSTLYNTAGVKQGLVVNIPTPGQPNTATGTPTGQVNNNSSKTVGGQFDVSETIMNPDGTTTTKTGRPAFIFATEDGTIYAWAPAVEPTNAILAIDNSNSTTPAIPGSVYKGLAIETSANGSPIIAGDPNSTSLLYASDFRNGKVDVFDTKFALVSGPGGSLAANAFVDPNLPRGFAPFNVQVLNVNGVDKVYVTYAKQDLSRHDDVAGLGNGFVDVYNVNGTGETRLVSRGSLDSPWGLAIAPSSFGKLAGSLLVGNFGNGHIHAYNATTGAALGQLVDGDNVPLAIDGLWALQVGNGGAGGLSTDVYFTAGIGGESHGLFGSLAAGQDRAASIKVITQSIIADNTFISDALNTLQSDIDAGASDNTIRQDIKAVDQSIDKLVQDEILLRKETIDLRNSILNQLGLGGKGGGGGDNGGGGGNWGG